jgi:molecular chaperone HscB
MDTYFDLFQIPIQLKVPKDTIKQKYFALSRQSHPDYFINSSTEEQQSALDNTARLNKALKTFNNQDETIKYVLEIKGLLEENEKYNLPTAFLMQMMELNEALSELQFDETDANKTNILQQVDEAETEIYEPVREIVENYKEGQTTEAELLLVKDYYFKKKYIERLKQQIMA